VDTLTLIIIDTDTHTMTLVWSMMVFWKMNSCWDNLHTIYEKGLNVLW